MSELVTKQDHWREVYRQQRLKNGQLWLEELEKTSDPHRLAATNYDKILQAIEQTLKHEDSFDTGLDLLREVFPIAYGMADWGRWLIYLKGALSTSQNLGNRSNRAYLHEWIADLELSLTNLGEAKDHFSQALKMYLDDGETSRYGRVLIQLSRVHASQGNIPKAMDLCNDALRLGLKNKAPIVVAGAHLGLAEIHFRMGEFEIALSQCNQAISKYEEANKKNYIFRSKAFAVGCKIYLKRYDEAAVEGEELMDLFNESEHAYDNLLASIHLRNVMGIMAYDNEDYQSAEVHWYESYQQSVMVGVSDSAASLGNNLGMVYIILDEFETAEAMFFDALSRYEQLGDVARWANCMDNLVDLYEKMGDLSAAEKTLINAISRLEQEANMAHSQKILLEMQERLENYRKN